MPPISSEEIFSKIRSDAGVIKDSDLEWFKSLNKKSAYRINLEDKENDGIIRMRNLWAKWILILIGIIIIFDIILVCLYGLGIWDFKDSNVVIVVITDNFLKIFGLGFLITRETFKKIYTK